METNRISPIRLREVDDLVGIIPHLLGFYPKESLVIIVTVAGLTELTARSDLEPLLRPGAISELLERIWARFPAGKGWFVLYGSDKNLAWTVLRRVEARLDKDRLSGSFYVGDDGCVSASPDGSPVSALANTSQAAAQAVLQGLSVCGSREEICLGLAGPKGSQRRQIAAVLKSEAKELDAMDPQGLPWLMSSLLDEGLRTGLSHPTRSARLALLCKSAAARQEAILAISFRNADQHFRLWWQVVAGIPDSYQQHPLELLGLTAWISGNGVVQSICAQRLEGEFPHSAALPVFRELSYGIIPPSCWDGLKKRLTLDADEMEQRLRA
ncbi:MAG: DUF4192 domain-containing protein [Propionibacteriaceae bacterium]|jgi:hypothetical protein|nr:DUF4192 domain-containing protein [Propionibacteriaceae bacterium]